MVSTNLERGSVAHQTSSLVRVIGRWSLAALMLNTIIGASLFGLPSLIAAHLGRLSPAGYVVTAVGVGLIAACLAEVASQFRATGGPYLYARAAFGPFLAIQIGWLTWLSRIAAASAAADLFISYLSQFLPMVERWAPMRGLVLGSLIGLLAFVNYRGVISGTRFSNVFTITKLIVVVAFVGGGLMALMLQPAVRVIQPAVPITAADWLQAVLLMINAFGGFEAALFVSGETRDPRKDPPIALLIALVTATLISVGMQYVVIHTLPQAAASTKPAADSAQHFLGPLGARFIAAGALVSVYGFLSANMLHTPRLTFAMGEQGDFPAFFSKVHPYFRTPYVSIAIFAAILIIFSVAGSYRWNATLSAVSRLFIYASIAAALPVLRRKQPNADAFRLPNGTLFSALAIAFTAILATRMDFPGFVVVASTATVAGLNWLWARRRFELRASDE
jgi:amino acid transporter